MRGKATLMKNSITPGHIATRFTAVLLSLSLVIVTLTSADAANRRSSQSRELAPISAPQTPTDLPVCTIPGLSLGTDATGDTGTGSVGTVPGSPQQDFTEIL